MFPGKIQELLDGNRYFTKSVSPNGRCRTSRCARAPASQTESRLTPERPRPPSVSRSINDQRLSRARTSPRRRDPLGSKAKLTIPELDPSTTGLTLWDFDRNSHRLAGDAMEKATPSLWAPFREILETLRRTIVGKSVGEYMNIQHPEEKRWCKQRMSRIRTAAP